MQFDGLLHDSYPIRGNRYVRQHWESGNYYLDGKFRLLDKGLRTLRINPEPSFAVRAHVINSAIENRDPVRWVLGDWLVDLSPQKRDYDNSTRFCVSHSITVTNQNGAFSDGAVGTFIDRLRLVLSVINMKCCEIVPTAAYDYASGEASEGVHHVRRSDRRLEVTALDLSGTLDQAIARVGRLAERVQALREAADV